ncbi:uncharacterized protein F4812DRAFT_428793 [Daldinia caldariorum]|uniref:uncharacterized protein n=1 Tax=Daldinia caldariorum TaxID=326644 RepID=UPI002007DB5B|nr:uncharacterized protein F4812DRAFT_428793 [Daldinia caldariorum]KAI1468080.1 hypothetical protein F4812DRAFT_428793 [Daldinia caldariorum]
MIIHIHIHIHTRLTHLGLIISLLSPAILHAMLPNLNRVALTLTPTATNLSCFLFEPYSIPENVLYLVFFFFFSCGVLVNKSYLI